MKTTFNLAALSAVVALAACGGSDPAMKDVEISFDAAAGDVVIADACSAVLGGVGTTGATARFRDFRFYISNVKFLAADGSVVPLQLRANDAYNYSSGGDSVTLIDLENGTCLDSTDGTTAINKVIRGQVPDGAYTGIEMTVGVPFAINHTDTTTAPPPLDIQAMAWNWQAGRKFAKIEITDPNGAAGSWTAKVFNFHLGSTGCTGNPATGQTVSCAAPKRMTFRLTGIALQHIHVLVDALALFSGNNVTVNAGGAAGCMSSATDPECPAIFQRIAVDLNSGQPINNGAGQVVFKLHQH